MQWNLVKIHLNVFSIPIDAILTQYNQICMYYVGAH